MEAVKKELPNLRLGESDFVLPRDRELPFTIESVETLFERPFQVPETAAGWSDRILAAVEAAPLLRVACDVLGSTPSAEGLTLSTSTLPLFPKDFPQDLKPVLKDLYRAVEAAQKDLSRAVASVSADARKDFLSLWSYAFDESGLIRQEISSQRIKQKFAGMTPFRQDDVLSAGAALFLAYDRVLPSLWRIQKASTETWKRPAGAPARILWETPLGVFLIGGPGDDEYKEEDLKDAVVLIDLGGRNAYAGPVAGAVEGEIRLVIDFGTDVTVTSDKSGRSNAASGLFGIGFMALPNPAGVKKFKTASHALGCGLGGIGALFIKGPAVLKGLRYVQGVGGFGVGILDVRESSGTVYSAERSGQGLGLVRGVGIFSHQGDHADIEGGLVEPDPREPLGSVSMCQGVGYGHRAYSGGGVGLAVLKGNGSRVQGSYFAQGCGYWRGMGIFRLDGDDSTLQARRYDQGTGVHSAIGFLHLKGHGNRVLNWGVGPAFGWDFSLGCAVIEGDENEVQVEWGSGTASISSLSFSLIRGNRDKLALPGYGTGHFFRNRPSYAIHVVQGEGNRLSKPVAPGTVGLGSFLYMNDPRGALRLESVVFEKDLKLEPPVWKVLPQETAMKMEMVDLQEILRSSDGKPSVERVSDLVDVAAAFSLDKQTPRDALRRLLQLPETDVPYLVRVLDPVAVEQLVQLQVALPAHGDKAASEIMSEIGLAPLKRKLTLLGFLSFYRPSLTFPFLQSAFRAAEETTDGTREKIMSMKVLGDLLNQDTGREPGLRAVRRAVFNYLKHPFRTRLKKQTVELLRYTRLGDAFGLARSSFPLSGKDRVEFLAAGPEDVTETIGEKGAEHLLKLFKRGKKKALSRLRDDVRFLDEKEPEVRKEFIGLLQSTRPAVLHAAITGLGQIAYPEDAPLLTPFLQHSTAAVREAAAVGLARMGPAGLQQFDVTMSAGPLLSRRLVMAALPQTTVKEARAVLSKGLKDPDAQVRLGAVTALKNLPDALIPYRKDLLEEAGRILSAETDPDVKLTFETVAAP
ncbi:MAG: HEAT repeat domain-containing protein [Elusimicrobia bacterium]|nr:HEAT repeat domain-containing protein [Candidatus Obscuribacterium magneticum]